MRHDSETVKIAAETTGLNAACYLHIDYGPDGRPAGVALSSPGKFEGGALDRLFGFVNKRLLEAFEPIETRGQIQPADSTPYPPASNSEVPER